MRTKRVGEKEELKMAKPAITDPAIQVVRVPNLKMNSSSYDFLFVFIHKSVFLVEIFLIPIYTKGSYGASEQDDSCQY